MPNASIVISTRVLDHITALSQDFSMRIRLLCRLCESQKNNEDGNHRVLVYAVFLRLHAEKYQPVRVIFSEDWAHIYPWAQLTA